MKSECELYVTPSGLNGGESVLHSVEIDESTYNSRSVNPASSSYGIEASASASYFQGDEYQNWVEGDPDRGLPTIHELCLSWWSNPRRKSLRKESRMKNYSASLNYFKSVLESYTPQDLRDDDKYGEFLSKFEERLQTKQLAMSTANTYIGILTSKFMSHANVEPRITCELKEDICSIRSRMKLPKPDNSSISDEDVVLWISKMDYYCEHPERAPNLNKIALETTKLKGERTSLGLLLTLRAYSWLCLITGGRADEIRRIKIDDINQNWVRRKITKGRLYTDSLNSNMRDWVWQRIEPFLDYIRVNHPNAEFLFSESDNVMGAGTISPKTLRQLVKGSMIDAGMSPTSPSKCYYRIHDFRKTIARWVSANGGSIECTTALLSHSGTDITFKAYFADEHKQSLAYEGQRLAVDHLKNLLEIRESVDLEIIQLQEMFSDLEGLEIFEDGGSTMPACVLFGEPGMISEGPDGISVVGADALDNQMTNFMVGHEATEMVRAPGLEPGTS